MEEELVFFHTCQAKDIISELQGKWIEINYNDKIFHFLSGGFGINIPCLTWWIVLLCLSNRINVPEVLCYPTKQVSSKW
jgi:hypothetical protein